MPDSRIVKAPTRDSSQRSSGMFYGWWIVLAGSVNNAYTSGTFWQGFGAFFDLIVAHFGWSRAITSAAVSIQRTESGMVSPFVGFFIEKFGPRTVMIVGIFVTGWGFIFLSQIQSLWQFYLAFVLITLGLSFGSFMVTVTTVANWFVAHRARAMGIMSAGAALGGLLVPVVIWVTDLTDWRTGILLVGVGFWVTGFPVALVMRSRPEDYGQKPDGGPFRGAKAPGSTPDQERADGDADTTFMAGDAGEGKAYTAREAVKTRAFWQMAMAFGTGQLIMSASIHQIPAISDFGFSRSTAGLILMGVAIVGLFGRLGSGYVGDVVDKRRVLALAFALQFAGTIVFAYTTTIWHLVGFMVLWGVGLGLSMPIRFAILADYFGREHFGSVMGILVTVSTVFGVVGPVFVGWMFDEYGNYKYPFLILSSTLLIAVPLILTLKRPGQLRVQSG